MIAYKGFLPGLICRGYQFRMGLNVTEKANCAHNGFHCAEDPLDCLRYAFMGQVAHAPPGTPIPVLPSTEEQSGLVSSSYSLPSGHRV